jgi:tetratricopeptide (TPR) repeat protein
MSKKQKKGKPRGWLVAPAQINTWLADAAVQLAKGDYERVLTTCRRILSYIPAKAVQRVDALRLLGNAHAMLKHFEESFQVLSEAVALAPNESDLWYNRGLSARFTSRTAQSLMDLERAVNLEGTGELAARFNEEVAFARRIAESERAKRGPNFTQEQVAEQQELFQHALNVMAEGRWEEAEDELRRVIAMADVLPQPWGNLGLTLIMQRRFDEAEAALRRALEIDPKYAIARSNLLDLGQIRETGQLPQVAISHPFERAHVWQTIHLAKG